MAVEANNQSIGVDKRRLLDHAIALLTELFDQHTRGGTYGRAGVEIQFEAGKPLHVRRTLDATHK